jgi:hypothetical protein
MRNDQTIINDKKYEEWEKAVYLKAICQRVLGET